MTTALPQQPAAAHPDDAPAEGVLLRDFNVFSAFSLAFAFVSPIVALYTIFGIGLSTVGPKFWWGFPITLAGQMLVALTFGQLASRWPFEGSVYQWARRLIGERYGWFTGWAYIWVLCIATAAVAYGGATFIAELFGLDAASQATVVPLALLLIAGVTWGNTFGRGVMKATVVACIGAEIIGSIGVGAWLLLFHREQGLGVLTQGTGVEAAGTVGLMGAPMVLAVAFAGWSFLGFESAGAIAEEVKEPQRAVPKAMAFSLLGVGVTVMFASLAIILAIPDVGAISAEGDPVVAVLDAQLGAGPTKAILVLFIIGFFASALAIQAAASRIVWALARDGEFPAAAFLSRLSEKDRLPTRAIVLCAVLSALLYALAATDLYGLLVTATSGGFYIAFALPVIGLAVARISGRWEPGPFLGGPLGTVVSWGALVWIVLETANIVWPRGGEGIAWWEQWAVFLVAGFILLVGVLVRRFGRGPAPIAPAEADVGRTSETGPPG